MGHRYAVYYAPPSGSRLEALGIAWLGRDHRSGEELPQPEVAGMAPARLRELTASPRRYGFHGTLKAPFRLAQGCDAPALHAALEQFAARHRPFTLAPLRLADIGGFLALVPSEPAPALDALAADCVVGFEPFRAPLTPAELDRRRRSLLTPRQEAQLEAYGYPYIFEDFGFHLTLTDRLAPPDKAILLPHLEAFTASVTSAPFLVDEVALYVEPAAGAPFRLVARYRFRG